VRRCVAAALVVLACAGCTVGGDAPALPAGRAILATPSIAPSVHVFGDRVTATLDVVVDASKLDPDRVQLTPRFFPYERVGDVRVERKDYGDVTRLRYTMQLRCLGPLCIPSRLASAAGPQEPGRGERKAFRFRPSFLVYDQQPRDRLLQVVRWPTLEAVSRINETQFGLAQAGAGQFAFRAGYRPLPGITWLLNPMLVVLLLALAALVLLTPAALLARRAYLERRAAAEPEPEPELEPLERALRLVEWSQDRPDGEDRRRALEALAEELATVESPLADDARALAWSPSSPSPHGATHLVARVREGTNGRPG
jgi:hypothetical protein